MDRKTRSKFILKMMILGPAHSVLLNFYQQRDRRTDVKAMSGHKTLALTMTWRLKRFLDRLHLIPTIDVVRWFLGGTAPIAQWLPLLFSLL